MERSDNSIPPITLPNNLPFVASLLAPFHSSQHMIDSGEVAVPKYLLKKDELGDRDSPPFAPSVVSAATPQLLSSTSMMSSTSMENFFLGGSVDNGGEGLVGVVVGFREGEAL